MLESLLSEQVRWHLGQRVLFIETLAHKWFQWAFPVSFSAFKTTWRYQRRNPRVVTGCVRKPVWVEFSCGHQGHMAERRARAETGLTNTAKATIWTGAAGKIQGSVEHAALMTSVDLQDIVGMSRKNDSAILDKRLHMAASGLTKNRTLFTMESFAGRLEVSLRWVTTWGGWTKCIYYSVCTNEQGATSSHWEYISPKTLHCKCSSSKSCNKLQIYHNHTMYQIICCVFTKLLHNETLIMLWLLILVSIVWLMLIHLTISY